MSCFAFQLGTSRRHVADASTKGLPPAGRNHTVLLTATGDRKGLPGRNRSLDPSTAPTWSSQPQRRLVRLAPEDALIRMVPLYVNADAAAEFPRRESRSRIAAPGWPGLAGPPGPSAQLRARPGSGQPQSRPCRRPPGTDPVHFRTYVVTALRRGSPRSSPDRWIALLASISAAKRHGLPTDPVGCNSSPA